LPLAYLTDGVNVPDDIRVADERRIAKPSSAWKHRQFDDANRVGRIWNPSKKTDDCKFVRRMFFRISNPDQAPCSIKLLN
jgi:hypothetical protein